MQVYHRLGFQYSGAQKLNAPVNEIQTFH